jgi:hypothetical protein
VLKPGGHVLVWALPKTAHWTGIAVEMAGFEPVDVITHVFGSGMPKSLNVGLAIDKHLGVESKVVGEWKPTGSARPEKGKKGHGNAKTAIQDTERENVVLPLKEPASEQGIAHKGQGTGLKPASEFWFLMRNQKPVA